MMVRRQRGLTGLAPALALALAACLPAIPPPPTAGYGAPYRGTGQTIFVKDSRTDWDIHEGDRLISAEQALEASGDQEYETRRQIAKAHNARLYQEAKQHRRLGRKMVIAGVAAFVGGLILSYVVAPRLTRFDVTQEPNADMPEQRHERPGAAAGVALLGTLGIWGGMAGAGYGTYGAIKRPPYRAWHIPEPLNRPAYIRRFTEEYNARLEDATAAGKPGEGSLRMRDDAPPPPRPVVPRPRRSGGGRR